VFSGVLKRALKIFAGLGVVIAALLALAYVDAQGQAVVLRPLFAWLFGTSHDGAPILYHDVYFVFTWLDFFIFLLLYIALCFLLAGAWTLIRGRRAK
jgi:hypothetical protein